MKLPEFCQIWVEFNNIQLLSHSKLRLYSCVEIGKKYSRFNFSQKYFLQRSNVSLQKIGMQSDSILIEIHSRYSRHSIQSFVCSIMSTLLGEKIVHKFVDHSVAFLMNQQILIQFMTAADKEIQNNMIWHGNRDHATSSKRGRSECFIQ